MLGVKFYPKSFLFPHLVRISEDFVYLHVMKTLIIHPTDRTTTFLTGIYKNLVDKTVITGGLTKDQLRKHILEHDRILMMGHGSPAGLFSVGRFPGAYPYIVDESMVDVLRQKTNSIFIWCYASEFVKRHNLCGFATEMFISEIAEGLIYGFEDADDLDNLIEQSIYGFAEIVSRHINEPLDVLHQNVLNEYGKLAKTNPIASFNFKRLYLSQPEPAMFPNNVGRIL